MYLHGCVHGPLSCVQKLKSQSLLGSDEPGLSKHRMKKSLTEGEAGAALGLDSERTSPVSDRDIPAP